MQREATMKTRKSGSFLITILAIAASGCGGDSTPPPTDPSPTASSRIDGVAAVGAAMALANVTVTDQSGDSACTEATVVTTGTGAYTCTLRPDKVAPLLVLVVDPTGAREPLVSVATSLPAAGSALVVNATPLTTALVGQLSPDGRALSVVGNRSLVDVATLAAVTGNVMTQLQPVLAAVGAPADYDPFTTPLVAATPAQAGNTGDQLLEVLRIGNVNGVQTMTTIDQPGVAIPMAGATTNAPQALSAPSLGVQSLAETVRGFAVALNTCFASPAAGRVLAADTTIPAVDGGPSITQFGSACSGLAHPDYRHNGYTFGQAFYARMNDPTMDGAVFSPPEIMRFVDDTSAADDDRAVVNFRFVDSNGNAANFITEARKIAGSATPTRPSPWWLYGNQQRVDSVIRAYHRRIEQLARAGTAPFTNAIASHFQAGFVLFVNKDGPGSSGLRAARVRGPGLPPAGVVLTRPDPGLCTEQSNLNIRRKDGQTDSASATFAADTGNFFRLQRTVGLSGSDATTVRPNPNASTSNNTTTVNWAHPLDYGSSPGNTSYIDYSRLRPNTEYSFEYFYDGETAPRYTYDKLMTTALVPATNASGLQWHALNAATLQYLNPTDALAAAQPSMSLSWTTNPLAPSVLSAGVYSFGGGSTVNQAIVAVVRGASSATAEAPGAVGTCSSGEAFRALTNDGTSRRMIQLRMRMTDGGYRDMTTQFN
jgi:hypothetical protein